MTSVYNDYVNRLKTYNNLINDQNKSIKVIAYLRLLTLIIGLSVTLYTFIIKSYYISIEVFIFQLLIFIYLIIKHDKEIKKRKYSIALKDINEKAIKKLDGQWKSFEDDGSEFKNEEHSYSNDLDIFGKGSLFQWINSSKTFMGRQNLKSRLTNPLKTSLDITKIQQSLQELATELEWRQMFEAEGMISSNECINPEELYKWSKDRNELYTKTWLILLVRLLPCITLILIILAYFTSLVNFKLLCFMSFAQLAILFIGLKKRSATFNAIYRYKNSINIYYKLLNLIIEKDFKSDYLKELKNNLVISKKDDAVKAIEKLANIYDKICERNNAIFMIVNVLLLWDYQCIILFEKWRIKSGKNLKKWFDVIGEFEALNSISNIIYDNPKWVMPSISDNNYIIKAETLGHPLLGEKMVCNNIAIDKTKNILLITGSNMSGKSTFLRTIGINLILSYIGAPVCAKKFECSLMQVFTCMRTSDNLENNISSFYAEILRIKMIVEEIQENKKVFFLLDELFKGTNSIDRHDGAIALIRQLGDEGASGLISTHDLELCDLQYNYSKIKNYHFKEYYLNNKLKFDYKIREGVSTTRNAIHLIKLAGIRIK
ncbi:MutS family DNA mismatch repair protein [Clostridium saccharobutylicum]|uniref:DNA mismatch repair protein MutS n=2 Tax=Clostridium saccharobutylicum TaxID=169679 RepID=U5MYN1_CLOSA|nr:MutS family DNA mismatch repair protein [Clostridium saccharobutylicum]AGX44597.1 DNA mismatch repair protein MutS [Clostridium saccharobutylicum DSM 13864]AQR91888.1 DNA mismatch repair protein MutS [Clostridium saccharobutylicum]AQS01790.1 DNA mismatch repair protein MutS [Clostridium saccharobutylicum]AQS15773.1 DNA mismatch repair protein MutS [Clostridium saccharobutylicum]MBA2906538.1 DNA mismatch repair ATPase MutS [Clostridium saccharobutylicum]